MHFPPLNCWCHGTNTAQSELDEQRLSLVPTKKKEVYLGLELPDPIKVEEEEIRHEENDIAPGRNASGDSVRYVDCLH